MKITIKQKHIDQGVRGSCTQDPVALALIEAGYESPWVSSSGLRFLKDRKVFNYDCPEELLEFMKAFDNELPVRPGEFELEG